MSFKQKLCITNMSLEDLYVVYQYMLVNVICRLTHMLFKILYPIYEFMSFKVIC